MRQRHHAVRMNYELTHMPPPTHTALSHGDVRSGPEGRRNPARRWLCWQHTAWTCPIRSISRSMEPSGHSRRAVFASTGNRCRPPRATDTLVRRTSSSAALHATAHCSPLCHSPASSVDRAAPPLPPASHLALQLHHALALWRPSAVHPRASCWCGPLAFHCRGVKHYAGRI